MLNIEWIQKIGYINAKLGNPKDGLKILAECDCILLGAVGFPGVPDHVSLSGLLLSIRQEFDQYINLRPIQLLEGLNSPLKNVKPEDINFEKFDRSRSYEIKFDKKTIHSKIHNGSRCFCPLAIAELFK